MPTVGERKKVMGDYSSNPMRKYAAAFTDVTSNIMRESKLDYAMDPARAASYKGAVSALREFYVQDSVIGKEHLSASEYQDQLDMMTEAFNNDIQAVRENASAGMSNYNPVIGMALPMHKYLMMNCVFAQAVPRFVAKSPSWTETMETRYLVTPDGTHIDIANEQNLIFDAWKSTNRPIEVPLVLPEAASVDILQTYFKVPRVSHNLSTATHICAVAVEDYAKTGDTVLTIQGTNITEKKADSNGKALVWKPVKLEFNPNYGEYDRIIATPVDIIVHEDENTEKVVHDSLFATQKDNMFTISTGSGSNVIKAVKLWARYDASSRMLKTCRVEWQQRTKFVQIPENDGITVPVTPEEIKDISALFGIDQITKYMSMIKDVLENVKDDDIKEQLDDSFDRLDNDHKLAKTIDFAPPTNYALDHLEWLNKTFMNTLDNFVTGLLSILRDPNMQVCVIGRPGIIRQITPVEYTYQTPQNVGPVELDFKKTVVTSDKRVYNFISSEKLWGSDNLIVLLIPKNTNRIIYRLYDYQMYISNEIRDSENPALPALTAFQRYKFFGFQELQGRIKVANPTGLRSFLPNHNPVDRGYTNNDLGSVYTHWDNATGTNVPTSNERP